MIDIALMIVLGRTLLDSDAVTSSGNGWKRLGIQPDVKYTVDIDPETVAAYRERERILRVLRG